METMYAGTSVVADRKQFMKGFPLRLEVLRDKPKYPTFIAILSRVKICICSVDVYWLYPGRSAHHRSRHISVMPPTFLDFRTSMTVYFLLEGLACS